MNHPAVPEMASGARGAMGRVDLVGAGPGDPTLITVRGLELLRRADAVLYDRLVPIELLSEPPASADLVAVGKRPGGAQTQQSRIHEMLIDRARAGQRVVRLKGGDPFVFGRGGEELLACQAADVPCEVTPGITSAVAVPAAVGVPVTLRNMSRSFVVGTGTVDALGRCLSDEEVAQLAGVDTVVLLMARQNLGKLAASLIRAGRPGSTPVAAISEGTTERQRCVVAELFSIADVVDAAALPSPMVVVVGSTAVLATKKASEPTGPLTGRRVAITQAAMVSSGALRRHLRAAGATVVPCPLIEVTYPAEVRELDSALRHIDRYDWLAFTSAHAVRAFWPHLDRLGGDARSLGAVCIAAVGSGTAGALWETARLRADLVPSHPTAEALVAALRPFMADSASPPTVLHPRGSRERPMMAGALRALGARVSSPVVYVSTPIEPPAPLRREVEERGVDAVLFCSPSTVHQALEIGLDFGSAAIGCIGPATAEAAREHGLEVSVSPTPPGARSLVSALGRLFANPRAGTQVRGSNPRAKADIGAPA